MRAGPLAPEDHLDSGAGPPAASVAAVASSRAGTVHDLPGVYRVCLLTGALGKDARPLHDDPDLLGHVWAGPYLAFPDAVTRVVHDDPAWPATASPCPTPGVRDWLATCGSRRCAPATRSAAGRPRPTAAAVERLHHPPSADAALLGDHPAHLHVDLLPRLQGRGWGRRVMDEVLDGLAAAGAPGVHLGVDEANTGAIAFYERLGFGGLSRSPGARTFGIRLPRPA